MLYVDVMAYGLTVSRVPLLSRCVPIGYGLVRLTCLSCVGHRLRVEIHEVGLLVGRPGGTGGGFKGGRDGRDSHEIPNAGPPQRSDRRDVVTDHMRQAGHGQVGVVESSCRERALTTDFRTHPWDATRVGERDVGRVWRSRSRRRDEGQDERKAMCRPSRRHSGPSRPLSRPVSPAHSRPRIPSRAPRDSEGAALRGTEVRPFRDLVREGMGKYGTDSRIYTRTHTHTFTFSFVSLLLVAVAAQRKRCLCLCLWLCLCCWIRNSTCFRLFRSYSLIHTHCFFVVMFCLRLRLLVS
eukprot:GHVR01084577.1.p1 GENE.GHVR01084577.1~~GHVR01084577.1.p1  ORF type:complete len:295 (+),score=32.69 GHVR01084577.1:35-919(+)